MAKATLKLRLPTDNYEVPILKFLKLPSGIGFLAGTDSDDHEFWAGGVPGEPVKLIGTFKENLFEKIRKAKAHDPIEIKPEDYLWVNPATNPNGSSTVAAESTTLGILKLDLSQPMEALAC
jgi:hypothetical protein